MKQSSGICAPTRSPWLEFGAKVEEGRQCGLTVTSVRDGGGLALDSGSADGDVFPL